MPSESVKPNNSHTSEGDNNRDKHKQLDREIREMVSAITNRVTGFNTSGSTHHSGGGGDEEEEHGVRIITLAGTNDGATLKSELDEKTGKSTYSSTSDNEPLSTFVNSNFQAINNSMMLGGSFHANDPGVHLDISDFSEPPLSQSQYHKAEKKKQGKKGKTKEKLEASKSEHHHHHQNDDDSD